MCVVVCKVIRHKCVVIFRQLNEGKQNKRPWVFALCRGVALLCYCRGRWAVKQAWTADTVRITHVQSWINAD